MKQLKDQKFTEATIKITKVRKHFKEGNSHTFKNKIKCVSIKEPTVITSTCFKDNFKGNRELIKFIKDKLYIK